MACARAPKEVCTAARTCTRTRCLAIAPHPPGLHRQLGAGQVWNLDTVPFATMHTTCHASRSRTADRPARDLWKLLVTVHGSVKLFMYTTLVFLLNSPHTRCKQCCCDSRSLGGLRHRPARRLACRAGTALGKRHGCHARSCSKWACACVKTLSKHRIASAPLECEALLDHGAAVGAADLEGRQPLHYAACQGRMDAVELQPDRGADLEASNGQTIGYWYAGVRPLQVAVIGQHPAAVEKLLARGAYIGATCWNGPYTAAHCSQAWHGGHCKHPPASRTDVHAEGGESRPREVDGIQVEVLQLLAMHSNHGARRAGLCASRARSWPSGARRRSSGAPCAAVASAERAQHQCAPTFGTRHGGHREVRVPLYMPVTLITPLNRDI